MIITLVLITILYVSANLLVGLWKLRGTTYSEFVACPGAINKYALTLSLCGTVIGGGMFFTVAQMGFEAGLAVLALPGAYVIGYLVLSFAIPAIRKSMFSPNVNTLYDIVSVRLPQGGAWTSIYKGLLSTVTFGMYFFMLSAQFTIIANFYVFVLGLSSTNAWLLSLLVIGGTTLIYSVAGGIRKDIATDVFQMIIVSAGLVVLSIVMIRGQGLSLSDVPSSHYTFTGYGTLFPIGILLFFSPSFVGRYDYWQRIIAAKSTQDARFALWLSLPIIVAAYVIFCFVGIYARSMSPNIDSAHAAVWFIRHALSPYVSLVVTLAFYAALMATSDTLLNVSSVSLAALASTVMSRYNRSIRSIRGIRTITIIVGLSASITVLLAADTVDLIIGGFSSLVIITPGLLYVLLTRRPSAIVGSASLLLGYLSFLIAFIVTPDFRKYAFILGFLIASAIIILGRSVLRIRSRQTFR